MRSTTKHVQLAVMPVNVPEHNTPRLPETDDDDDEAGNVSGDLSHLALTYAPKSRTTRVLRALGIRYRRFPSTFTYHEVEYTTWRGERYCSGEPKPVLRGVLHLVSAFTIMPLEAYLVAHAVRDLSTEAAAAAFVAVAAVWLLLLVSGLYHRVRWTTVPWLVRMQRCDHANIFLFGAACLTAQALLLQAAPGDAERIAGDALLLGAWGLALGGVIYSFLATAETRSGGHMASLRLLLYTSLGACVLPVAYWLAPLLTTDELVHQVVNVLFSLLSVLIFRFRWFDLWPDVFGTHEVFHVVVLLGTSSSVWLACALAQRIDAERA